MRRKDREMPEAFAREIVDRCEWAVVAMATAEGEPYCVPLTIVRKDDWIYFHCAKQGQKLDRLRENPRVCVACVGDTNRGAAGEFTTEYESAIVRGTAQEVTDEAEKKEALYLLCLRHTPQLMEKFESAAAKSLSVTGVWKISMDSVTGKRKKCGKNGKELKYGATESDKKETSAAPHSERAQDA